MSLRTLRIVCCFLLFVTTVSFTACSTKKNGTGDPAKPQEQGLVITFTGVSETTPSMSPGESYPFTINLTSAMPAEGVTVVVTVATVSGTPIPQPAMAPVTTAPISVTLVGLPDIKTCNVTITVTSNSNPKNTVTKTFQITNKA